MLFSNHAAKYDLQNEAFRETDRSVAAGTQIAVGGRALFHTLHYDVAYYAPGCNRHPGERKDLCAFAPLTSLGLEKLLSAPAGKWDGHFLHTTPDDDGEAVMEHLEDVEVHM